MKFREDPMKKSSYFQENGRGGPSRLAVLLMPLLASGAVFCARAAEEGTGLPQALELSRYQALMEKSPFAPATPQATPPPVVETPSFARDYYITGIAQMGEKPFVTFASKDKQTFFSLCVGESFQGLTLTNVEWRPELGKSTATLERAGESGVVGFDEVAIHEAPVVQATPTPVPQAEAANNDGNRRRRWTREGNNGWFSRGGGEGRGWSRRNRAIPAPNGGAAQ